MLITERERETLVQSGWDVAVVGGGFAGAAAALAAARQGRKTLLIEREFLPGGLGTLGLVTVYLPLCDGMGKQVSFGIAEELLRLSIKRGAQSHYPSAWLGGGSVEERTRQRFLACYNPWTFAIDLEQLLVSEGVEILYGTSVCGVETKERLITHLYLENIEGRTAVAVKSVVDASGNAIVAEAAGAGTHVNSVGNVLSSWYYFLSGGEQKLVQFSENFHKLECGEPVIDNVAITGLDAWENSRVLITTRKRMMEDFIARGEKEGGPVELLSVPTIQDLRMTRRITGRCEASCVDHRREETSIGCIGDWRHPGAYEIPYGSLRAEKIDNLWAAGRCMASADGDAWDICRVIPVCAVTGEASGIAAALAVSGPEPDVREVQIALREKGVRLHLSDC